MKKKKTIHALVMSASILSAILVFSISFTWQGSSIHIAQIAKALYGQSSAKTQTSGTTTAARATSSNTIQLSVKEESEDVYKWVSSSDGAINPTLKISANNENIIKIQNPTDTKHELVIDTTNSHPSSGDINPNSSGQLSFKPTMTGTITYHCEYHPQTMKRTIQVVSGP